MLKRRPRKTLTSGSNKWQNSSNIVMSSILLVSIKLMRMARRREKPSLSFKLMLQRDIESLGKKRKTREISKTKTCTSLLSQLKLLSLSWRPTVSSTLKRIRTKRLRWKRLWWRESSKDKSKKTRDVNLCAKAAPLPVLWGLADPLWVEHSTLN